MRRQALLYAIGLSLALAAADASAAEAARGDAVQTADHNSGRVIHDLGPLPSDGSDHPIPAPSSANVNSAQAAPVPELPTWAMMLLCLAGLGLAGLKKGRKDRLSPGIE